VRHLTTTGLIIWQSRWYYSTSCTYNANFKSIWWKWQRQVYYFEKV